MINDDRFIPVILEGQVVRTDDPDQMGRVKVWIPALDGEFFEISALPWAEYASPLAGFTVDYPAGGTGGENTSHAAYGFWAIPKLGATVLVFCLGGDPSHRFYFASTIRLHRNRSLPAGRNFDDTGKQGPWGDAGDGKGSLNPIEPAFTNLRTQFQNKIDAPEAVSRGSYERQVAEQKYDKTGTEGYSNTPVEDEDYLDSQTYCFVTPGRHALIFQDHPKYSRLRLKTAEGSQIIFDDANERIYISTSQGKTWIELDQDGRIHIFGSDSINIRAGDDINLYADRDINLEANRNVNVKSITGTINLSSKKDTNIYAGGDTLISACVDIQMSATKAFKLTSGANFDILSKSDLTISANRGFDITAGEKIRINGTRIDFNGPAGRTAENAKCAAIAGDPSVVPGHEPWPRATSKKPRGKNWKA